MHGSKVPIVLGSSSENLSRLAANGLLLNDRLLIAGGITTSGAAAQSILEINLQSGATAILYTNLTISLEGAVLFSANDKIMLWGVTFANETALMSSASKISAPLLILRNSEFEVLPLSSTSEHPPFRIGFAYTQIGKKYFLIHGGSNIKKVYNDWWLLNIENMSWKRMKPNREIGKSFFSSMFWIGGEGILYTEEAIAGRVAPFQLYYVKIPNYSSNELIIGELITNKNPPLRSSPMLCGFMIDNIHPTLAMIGGEQIEESGSLTDESWFLDISTLEWTEQPHIRFQSRLGGVATYYNNRIYVIGGAITMSNMSPYIEYCPLKEPSPEERICLMCQSVYGYDATPASLVINADYLNNHDYCITTSLLKKLSKLISNPMHALSLLLDNSFNMNSTMTSIYIRKTTINNHNLNLELNSSNNNISNSNYRLVLVIEDNSTNFSNDEALTMLQSFGYHENQEDDETYYKKEYAINLKLSAMRLGKACLFVTQTTNEDIFVGYFSSESLDGALRDTFTCYWYYITAKGGISSYVNYDIIGQNVRPYFPKDEYKDRNNSYTTRVYIIDTEITKNIRELIFEEGETPTQTELRKYLEMLYLRPLVGRKLMLDNHELHLMDNLDHLLKQTMNLRLKRISTVQVAEHFKLIALFEIVDNKYPFREILVYQNNRLIMSLGEFKTCCGLIEVKDTLLINLFKNKLENNTHLKNLRELIFRLTNETPKFKHHKI